MLIRMKRTPGNAGGRAGCQVKSPFTGAIHYVTLEQGRLLARNWNGDVIGQEATPVTLVPVEISADFAAEGQLCVTVTGFPANTNDSGQDTYVFGVQE